MSAAETESSFETIVSRLEQIAGRLEGDDTSLEDALALFEEGMCLSKTGSQRLDAAERRLEQLLEDGRTVPLALGDAAEG